MTVRPQSSDGGARTIPPCPSISQMWTMVHDSQHISSVTCLFTKIIHDTAWGWWKIAVIGYYRYSGTHPDGERCAKFFLCRFRIYRSRWFSRESAHTKKRRSSCHEFQPLLNRTRGAKSLCPYSPEPGKRCLSMAAEPRSPRIPQAVLWQYAEVLVIRMP